LAIAGGTMTGPLILNSDPSNSLEADTKQYVDNATSSISIPSDISELTDVTNLLDNNWSKITFDGSDFESSDFDDYSESEFILDGGEFTFDGKYASLIDKPTLFDGDYYSLTNAPDLFDGAYSSLTGKPDLFSGSYNDLTNKPTLSTVSSSGEYADLLNKPNLSTVATSGSYADLSDKPTIPSLTGYATESYVNSSIANLVDTAPTTLNTLNELATALGDDANFAATVTTALGTKANTSSLAAVATSGSYNDLSNKPAPSYAQATGNISIPYGTSLPATVISGTITTTGGPVRLHVSGNVYNNAGGANGIIQFLRGTTGVGITRRIPNEGRNAPFVLEYIDVPTAGTYTYTLKVLSDIGNGANFSDIVLTIIELK
jgi:hypothetical protein